MPLVAHRCISVAPVFPTFARERLARRLFGAIEAADAAVVTSNGWLAIGLFPADAANRRFWTLAELNQLRGKASTNSRRKHCFEADKFDARVPVLSHTRRFNTKLADNDDFGGLRTSATSRYCHAERRQMRATRVSGIARRV